MFSRFTQPTSRALAVCVMTAAVLTVSSAYADGPGGRGPRYKFETVDVPYGELGVDVIMQILWINNDGVVTAQYQSPPSSEFLENMHTAALERRKWKNIDVDDAVSTGGTNANNRGQVALSYDLGDGVFHVGIHGKRGLKAFPDIPGYSGGLTAQGINDRGQIAAVIGDGEGNWHGLFGDGEDYAIFDYPDPNTVYTQANMINNRGVGVGTYITSDDVWHAFKWECGEISNIDPDPEFGNNASATAINNHGIIVGVFINPDGQTTGYLQDSDEFTEFGVPEATFTVPYMINDRGQIAGVYGDADGVTHGFVATPRRRH